MADNSAIEWTDATWNPIRARNIKTGKVGWHCEHATAGRLLDGVEHNGFPTRRIADGV
jgi:protein gp37